MSFGNKKICENSPPATSFHSHTLGSVFTLFAASTSSIRLSGRPPASGSCSRWNKGCGVGNQSQRGSVEMVRAESGPGARISPFPGAEDGDTRIEAQRKLGEDVKSCRNPRKGASDTQVIRDGAGAHSRLQGLEQMEQEEGELPWGSNSTGSDSKWADEKYTGTGVSHELLQKRSRRWGRGSSGFGGHHCLCGLGKGSPSLNLSFPHLHPLGLWFRSGKADGPVIAPGIAGRGKVAGI